MLLFILVVWVDIFRSGDGWAYLFSVSKHLRDSCISLFGKNGNCLWIIAGVGGVLKLCTLCIEFGGSIMSWWVSINLVYGCCIRICLSGGLVR